MRAIARKYCCLTFSMLPCLLVQSCVSANREVAPIEKILSVDASVGHSSEDAPHRSAAPMSVQRDNLGYLTSLSELPRR